MEELKTTFTHYDKQDTRKALIAALNMFRRIATQTAEKLGYDYPEDGDRSIREWLITLL